jgi:hypothetical protein
MHLLKQIAHGQSSLVIGKPFEAIKDLARYDFLLGFTTAMSRCEMKEAAN